MSIVKSDIPQSLSRKRVQKFRSGINGENTQRQLNMAFEHTRKTLSLIVTYRWFIAQINRSRHIRSSHIGVVTTRVDQKQIITLDRFVLLVRVRLIVDYSTVRAESAYGLEARSEETRFSRSKLVEIIGYAQLG